MALKVQLVQPHREAISLIRDKPALTREVFDRLLPELRVRAFTVTGIEAAQLLQRLRDEIATLPAGQTWDQVKANVADALPFEPEAAERRAELLLRIHGFQAFQAAVWQVAQADPETTHLQYLTMEDERVRPAHRALDGVVLPKDDPFWEDHLPPWDWGCRCRVRPLNARQVDQIRRADLRKRPEARRVLEGPALQQLRHGTRITPEGQRVDVTPPRFKPGGSSAFQWHPDSLLLPLEQLRKRFDPEVWAAFESWAKATELWPGQTLWQALQKPLGPPPPSAPRATPPKGQPPLEAPAPTAPISPDAREVAARVSAAKLPPEIQEAARKLPDPVARLLDNAHFKVARGGYYHPATRTIHMAADPRSWAGGVTTFYHECGHHVCERAGVYRSGSGPGQELSEALEADWRRLQGRLEAAFPGHWQQWANRKDWDDSKYVELGQAFGYLPSEETRQFHELPLAERKRLSRLADMLCSLSGGRYGCGHSAAYTKQLGWYAEPPAHAVSALLEGDPVFQQLFPQICRVVKSALGL